MNTTLYSKDRQALQPSFAVGLSDTARDEALVAAAMMGEEKAFETLVTRYQPRIFALALRYTGIREDAEDVVQQTFQKTFVYLKTFEGKSSFATWLTRIAINEALMWLRKARGLREVSLDDLGGNDETAPRFDVPDARPDPEATYLQQEETRILSIAIARLTPQLRSVLELKELRELSARETAQHTGLSVAAVKARVFHGRKKLIKHIRIVGSRRIKRAFQQSRIVQACLTNSEPEYAVR
jgi:RNA polymerase sigma-70 factor (ECF subfamily)